jgi:hypothetical protein
MTLLDKRNKLLLPQPRDNKRRRRLMEEPHPLTNQRRENLKKTRKNKDRSQTDLYAGRGCRPDFHPSGPEPLRPLSAAAI